MTRGVQSAFPLGPPVSNRPAFRGCHSLALLLLTLAAAAADPYATWQQGRPAEAIPALTTLAQATDTMAAWYDLGLAQHAAGDHGAAAAALLIAHRRAPLDARPRDALRQIGSPLPTTWADHLGPVAMPARGWSGLMLAILAGVLLALALTRRHARTWTMGGGLIAAWLLAPGLVAAWLDTRRPWAATLVDSSLHDSRGLPQRSLPAGTLVERTGTSGVHAIVRLGDGSIGLVPRGDLGPGL